MAAAKKLTAGSTAVAVASAAFASVGFQNVEGDPTYVRLLDIATRSGGVLLPVGKSLQVGVDIPEALAEARLAAGTAELVQGSAITAQKLRAALIEVMRHLRGRGEVVLAAAEGAGDADLLSIVEDSRFGADDETRLLAEALDEALDRHRVAIEAETETPSGPQDGGGAGPGVDA